MRTCGDHKLAGKLVSIELACGQIGTPKLVVHGLYLRRQVVELGLHARNAHNPVDEPLVELVTGNTSVSGASKHVAPEPHGLGMCVDLRNCVVKGRGLCRGTDDGNGQIGKTPEG